MDEWDTVYMFDSVNQPHTEYAVLDTRGNNTQFKKYMGQTLISYINDLKLNHVCNQLKSTNFPLIDIAKSAGFESYPHFSRLFKSKFGLSPLQYRASNTSDKF